jgi:hypothetical protein
MIALVARGLLLGYAVLAGLRARLPGLWLLLVPALASFALPLWIQLGSASDLVRVTRALEPVKFLPPLLSLAVDAILAVRAFRLADDALRGSEERTSLDGAGWALGASALFDATALLVALLAVSWHALAQEP